MLHLWKICIFINWKIYINIINTYIIWKIYIIFILLIPRTYNIWKIDINDLHLNTWTGLKSITSQFLLIRDSSPRSLLTQKPPTWSFVEVHSSKMMGFSRSFNIFNVNLLDFCLPEHSSVFLDLDGFGLIILYHIWFHEFDICFRYLGSTMFYMIFGYSLWLWLTVRHSHGFSMVHRNRWFTY